MAAINRGVRVQNSTLYFITKGSHVSAPSIAHKKAPSHIGWVLHHSVY